MNARAHVAEGAFAEVSPSSLKVFHAFARKVLMASDRTVIIIGTIVGALVGLASGVAANKIRHRNETPLLEAGDADNGDNGDQDTTSEKPHDGPVSVPQSKAPEEPKAPKAPKASKAPKSAAQTKKRKRVAPPSIPIEDSLYGPGDAIMTNLSNEDRAAFQSTIIPRVLGLIEIEKEGAKSRNIINIVPRIQSDIKTILEQKLSKKSPQMKEKVGVFVDIVDARCGSLLSEYHVIRDSMSKRGTLEIDESDSEPET